MIINNYTYPQKQNNLKNPSFKATFFYSDTLRDMADYAVKTNKIKGLHFIRQRIERQNCFSKIKIDLITEDDGNKYFMFRHYIPDYELKNGKILKKYHNYTSAISKFQSFRDNHSAELFRLLIRMAKNAPNNKIYQKVFKTNQSISL